LVLSLIQQPNLLQPLIPAEILADFEKYEGKRSCFSRPFDGKTHHGKVSFAELKDAEGRIQVYVSRDDISTDEEKTMYNVVFKTVDIGILLGFAVVLKRKW
jgi:lysyl-tRNA synthetase class 2